MSRVGVGVGSSGGVDGAPSTSIYASSLPGAVVSRTYPLIPGPLAGTSNIGGLRSPFPNYIGSGFTDFRPSNLYDGQQQQQYSQIITQPMTMVSYMAPGRQNDYVQVPNPNPSAVSTGTFYTTTPISPSMVKNPPPQRTQELVGGNIPKVVDLAALHNKFVLANMGKSSQKKGLTGWWVAFATWIMIKLSRRHYNDYYHRLPVTDLQDFDRNLVVQVMKWNDNDKEESIWEAVVGGNKPRVEELFQKKPDVFKAHDNVGCTPFLIAMLRKNYEMVIYLTKHHPILLMDQFSEGENYCDYFTGESVLHFAIVHRKLSLVEKLVKLEPRLLYLTATGKFFGVDQVCGYGEWPLFFAICTKQTEIAKFLIEQGADITAVDSHGNTILHILVYRQIPEMLDFIETETNNLVEKLLRKADSWLPEYKQRLEERRNNNNNGSKVSSIESSNLRKSVGDYIAEVLDRREKNSNFDLPFKPEEILSDPLKLSQAQKDIYWTLSRRKNNAGATPLALSTELGYVEIFGAILNRQTTVLWKYGTTTCRLFPLHDLDNFPVWAEFGERGTNPSVLERVMEHYHVRFFSNDIVRHLVDEKWRAICFEWLRNWRFAVHFAVSILFLAVLTTAYLVHYNYQNDTPDYVLMALVAFFTLLRILFSTWQIWNHGIYPMLYTGGGAAMFRSWTNLFFYISCACTAGFHFQEKYDEASVSNACIILFGYIHVLFYGFAMPSAGPFLAVMWRILRTDFMRFLAIYITFWLAFGFALYGLAKSATYKQARSATALASAAIIQGDWSTALSAGNYTPVNNMGISDALAASAGTFLSGMNSALFITGISVAWFGILIFVLWLIISSILLLNLLIAMMSSSANNLTSAETATQLWLQQRLSVTLSIERALFPAELKGTQYWVRYRPEGCSEIGPYLAYRSKDTPEDEEKDKEIESKGVDEITKFWNEVA